MASANQLVDKSMDSVVFDQIQNCGDVISSILLICEYITEHAIATNYNLDQLRNIALRSFHSKTCTYLWHINALIAVSPDLQHLLLGIEMIFDQFLGNKDLFLKQKQNKAQQSGNNSLHPTTTQNHKFVSDEIISLVNNLHSPKVPEVKDYDRDDNEIAHSFLLQHIEENDENNENIANSIVNKQSENTLVEDIDNAYVDKKEAFGKLATKQSSPISFRLRQQKRIKQKERKTKRGAKMNKYEDLHQLTTDWTPRVVSPFDVRQFAKTVDAVSSDLAQFQLHSV